MLYKLSKISKLFQRYFNETVVSQEFLVNVLLNVNFDVSYLLFINRQALSLSLLSFYERELTL